ncbi:hypothetical protein [Solidesulfovibrio alcoholivorans]|uniref:hypothetical protein n=1 Tax=Solidesulfovibrio alcoholivorans TaxID=81406 RepID=UPI0004981B9A|nr:hypothetical protein [Solidesulfovibrio alcoholivorans]
MLVWLEPAAVEALEQLKAASPGASVANLASRAVILAAGMESPVGAGPVAGGPDPEVVGIKAQLAVIEARMASVEGSVEKLAQASQSSLSDYDTLERIAMLADRIDLLEAKPATEPKMPKSRKSRGKFDEPFLLAAIADRIERDGEDFVVAELHRDLVEQGVELHSQASNFWSFYDKHRADVAAILDQRRADRGEG